MYNSTIYESKEKFEVKENEFMLILDGVVISKSGFNIESSDEFFDEPYVSLYEVETVKKYRGKGYAHKLFNHIFEFVKNSLEIKIITLIVYKENIKAIKLYNSLGFEIFMEYEDSYSLVKHLI